MIWRVARPRFYDVHPDLKYTPTNVAVAPSGDVYFADGYGSWFIHHLDKDGNYKKTFGGPIDDDTKATIHPHGLYVDVRGKEPLVVVARLASAGVKPSGRRRCAARGTSTAGATWSSSRIWMPSLR